MKQRAYDRMAAVLSITLLAGLGGFSYYLAELAERGDRRPVAKGTSHEPDYFVEGFALTRTNLRGEPTFRVSAERLTHYPNDDSSELTRPVLVSLDPSKPEVTLRADRGRASAGGKSTELFDGVTLVRKGGDDRPELRVETSYALVLPEEDVARTDRPVRITHGASSLTGDGMEFDNAARVLTVRSNVQGVWTPAARR
ncbi:MAG: hypothetical protein RIS35_1220 [Pseudomonadota bacterium]|jgi:lipopolysaccharide export system protein LptC